ncbi:MAG TPA: tetratricopeptide repeat protein [Candidatus Hydrogenedentes bacterium]|nr:tetratricopeptide repeat protein [Candidatus Hydrogenedentota bacterium]
MSSILEKLKVDQLRKRGMRLADNSDFQGALAIFEEVAKRSPDMPLAYSNVGFCLFRLGKTTEAISAYERAWKLAPEDPRHAYDLGCVLYTSGQKEKALDCFLNALKSNPDYKEAYAALETTRADLNIPATDPRLAGILPAAPAPPPPAPEKSAPAEKAQSKPVAPPSAAKKVQPEVISALIAKGTDLYEKGEFAAALNAWTEATRLDPANAKAHNNRAAALYELGKHQEAIEACTAALSAQPGYAIAHMTRGEIYAAMGNRDAVMREFTALNAIDEELAQQLIEMMHHLKETSE